jgi:hypothetical protein
VHVRPGSIDLAENVGQKLPLALQLTSEILQFYKLKQEKKAGRPRSYDPGLPAFNEVVGPKN